MFARIERYQLIVLIINELKHVKCDIDMKLDNIIWIIFGMPTFYTVGTDISMLYEKNNNNNIIIIIIYNICIAP